MMLIYILTLLIQFSIIGTNPVEGSSIKVEINNLKNNQGQICILLFNNSDGYPSDFDKAQSQIVIKDFEVPMEVLIDNIKEENIVITVLHDENMNGKIDKNIFGIPTEGYGISKNPKPTTFGPPPFENAKVKMKESGNAIQINMKY